MYKKNKHTKKSNIANKNTSKKSKIHAIKLITEIKTNKIKATIENMETNCLVDSGAQISAINEKFFSQINSKNKDFISTKLKIKTAINNQSYSVTGKIDLPIIINKVKINHSF